MSNVFTTALRQRFSKLLLLAAESPYKGEQEAALAAAERLAKGCDMTLDEAARLCREPDEEPRQAPKRQPTAREEKDSDWARSFHSAFKRDTSEDAAASRQRQQELWDAEDKAKKDASDAYHRNRRQQKNGRRVPPRDFACTLMRETDFPLSEIASITQLPLQDLIAQKLKMRGEIKSYQEAQRRKAEERRRKGLARGPQQPRRSRNPWDTAAGGRKASSGR
ncbi:hypothetical protein ACTL6U_07195 [Rhodovibrionaceae bacterium A322]